MTFEQALNYYHIHCIPEEVDGMTCREDGALIQVFGTDGVGPVDAWWNPVTREYVAVALDGRVIYREGASDEKSVCRVI